VTKLAIINFDGGGLKPGPVTAACVVELSDGPYGAYAERFDEGTHNTAEYHALILGLRMALAHGARQVKACGDSQLVVDQINGTSKTKQAGLLPLRARAMELLAQFEHWDVVWIRRAENKRADELGRMMMMLELPGQDRPSHPR
jgi:ribonuclease HI